MFETTITLIIFLFPLAYSPGPGNMFFAANAARFGWRSTVSANAGYHVATWAVTLAIGLGINASIATNPFVFNGLRVIGALYVLWIAWNMYKSPPLDGAIEARAVGAFDGAMLLVLNPKAYVIMALMFTQFLDPSATEHGATVLLITSVFTLNNLIAFIVWSAAGDTFARRFRKGESAHRLNRFFAVVLAGVAVWMLLI